MNEINMKRFIKLWKNEYAATIKIQDLDEKIDNAMIREAPTARLQNNHDNWSKKQDDANKEIRALIKSGDFPQDAITLCKKGLGILDGYVCECYFSMWQDRNLELEYAKQA